MHAAMSASEIRVFLARLPSLMYSFTDLFTLPSKHSCNEELLMAATLSRVLFMAVSRIQFNSCHLRSLKFCG